MQKTKLTLWMRKDIAQFGKRWTSSRHESLSSLLAAYLERLQSAQTDTDGVTARVRRLSGVIKDKTAGKESYKKHILNKYI